MGVQCEPIVGVMVRNGAAVEINVGVGVGALRKVVVIQRADDGQSQREQRSGEEQHPAQRGRIRSSTGSRE